VLITMRHHSSFPLRVLRSRAIVLFVFFVVAGVLLSQGVPVFAQGDFGIAKVDSQIGLSGTSIVLIIVRVIRILLGFLGLVLVIMFLYAGFLWMTSSGNEDKVTTAKTIIKNAVIGTAIILFSFIIVQFVINILSQVTGATSGSKQPPGIETFSGIGSLGLVIQDHYPLPNQTGVYRNTKISITFTEEIDPASIIENTNNSCWALDGSGGVVPDAEGSNCKKENGDNVAYYGDCIDTLCDTVQTDVISIQRRVDKNGVADGEPVSADALVAYENGTQAHIFVFKPRELLGNGETDQWHTVTLSENGIENILGENIFRNYGQKGYTWQFETNTEIDMSPPYVVDVSPASGETIEKNRILQITFNEAVDPMTVQGMLGVSSSFSNVIVQGTSGAVAPSAPPAPETVSGDTEPVYALTYLNSLIGNGNRPTHIVHTNGSDVMYVAYFNTGIAEVNVSDPTKPVFTGKIFSTARVAYGEIHSILISGNTLLITSGNNAKGALQLIDTVTMTEISSFSKLTDPQAIAMKGRYVYVADMNEGIKVINISDTSKPAQVASYGSTVDKTGDTGGSVNTIAIQGNYLFYGQGGSNVRKFGVLDISQPEETPVLVNEADIPAPVTMVINSTRAYIAVANNQIKIIDITNPEKSLPQATFMPNSNGGVNGLGIRSLDLSQEGLLLVGEQYAFQLFDVNNDVDSPVFLATNPIPGWPLLPLDNDRPVLFNGQYVYVGHTGQGLFSFDTVQTSVTEGTTESSPTTEVKTLPPLAVNGQWKITNGYRSIEFLSSDLCGNDAVNSCGEPLYCLPTGCSAYDTTCVSTYSVLARTASLKNADVAVTDDSFVASGLFDGVVDMADNVLDSGTDIDQHGSIVPGSYDFEIYDAFADSAENPWRHKPPFVGIKKDIDDTERYPDNYWWNFTVVNDIDSTSPYIRSVGPSIDQQGVDPFTPVDISFSKAMWMDSFSLVRLVEYPNSGVGVGYVPDTDNVTSTELLGGIVKEVTRSILHLRHPARPFGDNGKDYWYFPVVSGKVKANNQFCLYPGRGPYYEKGPFEEKPLCNVVYDETWHITSVSSACRPEELITTSSTDTGCISAYTTVPTTVADTASCVTQLSNPAVSHLLPSSN